MVEKRNGEQRENIHFDFVFIFANLLISQKGISPSGLGSMSYLPTAPASLKTQPFLIFYIS